MFRMLNYLEFNIHHYTCSMLKDINDKKEINKSNNGRFLKNKIDGSAIFILAALKDRMH